MTVDRDVDEQRRLFDLGVRMIRFASHAMHDRCAAEERVHHPVEMIAALLVAIRAMSLSKDTPLEGLRSDLLRRPDYGEVDSEVDNMLLGIAMVQSFATGQLSQTRGLIATASAIASFGGLLAVGVDLHRKLATAAGALSDAWLSELTIDGVPERLAESDPA